MITKQEFEKGWKHFCSCMDFARSNMDAGAIQFMNEVPGKVLAVLDAAPDLLKACKETEKALSICIRYFLGTGPQPDPDELALAPMLLQEVIAEAEGGS